MRVPVMALVLLLTALSSGCTSVDTNACPKPKAYTKAEQAQAAREISALPENAVLRMFVDDYHNLRKQVRACK